MADLRKEYSAVGLEEAALPQDPFPLFRQWLEEAVGAQVRPSVRQFVLDLALWVDVDVIRTRPCIDVMYHTNYVSHKF